jgi:hypothetical protein
MVVACAVSANAQTQSVGRITLCDGETLGGAMTGLTNGVVEWTHRDALRPFHFAMTNVTEFVFEGRPDLARTPPQSSVRMAAPDGGDDLFANMELLSLDADRAIFESVMLDGRFAWPRRLLKGVFFSNRGGAVILSGPADSNGWFAATAKPGDGWLAENGMWVSNGRSTLSRELNLPDRVRIDFDLDIPKPINFKLGFFANPCTNDFRETVPGYYLECRAYGEAVLQRADATNRVRTLKASAKHLVRAGRTHYTLLADRGKKRFALLANGMPACTWQDEGDLPTTQRFLVLMSMGKPQAIGGLAVLEWHGNFDAAGPFPAACAEDVLYDIQGAQSSGRIAGVEAGRLTQAGGSGVATRELAKTERIDFASEAASPAVGTPVPEWRILLTDSSELSAVPVEFAGDRLMLALPGGGTCKVRVADVLKMSKSAKTLTR